MSFGTFVRELRIEKGISMRKFAELIALDAGFWSKIERDLVPMPDNAEKMQKIAEALSIPSESPLFIEMSSLASISRKSIPDEVLSDAKLLEALPVFFRSAYGGKPTEEELDNIIKILRGENDKQSLQ